MTDASRPADESSYGWPFWTALAAGTALMGWGVALFLDATPDTHRRVDFAKWIVGLDLAHDFVMVPIVLIVGFGVGRAVRGSLRAPVQAGLIVSGFVLAVAASPLRHTAGTANATIQPLDYESATLTVLALVWLPMIVWGAARERRARKRTTSNEPASSAAPKTM